MSLLHNFHYFGWRVDELVSNINAETGGVVAANVNEDGKLVLSNSTGATITVEDDSTSGSGFSSTATTFKGFLKLEGLDDEPIRVTRGNKGLAAPGTDADLLTIGFRETKASTLEDGYTVMSESHCEQKLLSTRVTSLLTAWKSMMRISPLPLSLTSCL